MHGAPVAPFFWVKNGGLVKNKHGLALCLSLSLVGCGGGSDTGPGSGPPPGVAGADCAQATVSIIPSAAQLVFDDGFESGNLSATQNGFRWTDSASTAVSLTRACTGNYSLEFIYAAAADNEDGMSEQRFYLGGNYRDVWFEYDLFVPENYYHRSQSGPTNNKGFLYLWANTYADPRPLVAINFWADGATGQSIGSVYTRPVDQHSFDFTAPAIASSDVGKWLHIVVHYAYASAANNDGVAQIWRTPAGGPTVQILNKTNGPWYHATGTGFDNGYLLGWANSGFSGETRFYIDNVRVYQDP